MKNSTLNWIFKVCLLTTVFAALSLFDGCGCYGDDNLRVKNSHGHTINVQVGDVDFGTIENNLTSGYELIQRGDHDVVVDNDNIGSVHISNKYGFSITAPPSDKTLEIKLNSYVLLDD